MKRFYLKMFLFTAILFAFISCFLYLSTNNSVIIQMTKSTEYNHAGVFEISPYIEKMRQEDGTTTLILGDSVAHQLFNAGGSNLQNINPEVSVTGSNAAITMTGQYILAKEYIQHHPDATDIYLLVRPTSLTSTFDTTYGYQYAVAPFVLTDTIDHLDEKTLEEMSSVYSPLALNKQFTSYIASSSVWEKIYLNTLKQHSSSFSMPHPLYLADQYLIKLYDLCLENDIVLHLLPCPMADSRQDSLQEFSTFYEKSALKNYFPDFVEQTPILPAEQFGDHIHFGGEYNTRTYFNTIIEDYYADSQILNALKLE